MTALAATALGLALVAIPAAAFAANEALWDLLRGGGQIVLMRHAITTPGVGGWRAAGSMARVERCHGASAAGPGLGGISPA